jgi:hypothetical protein
MSICANIPDVELAFQSGINMFYLDGPPEELIFNLSRDQLGRPHFGAVLYNRRGFRRDDETGNVIPELIPVWCDEVDNWTVTHDDRAHENSAIKVADEVDDESLFPFYRQVAERLRGFGTFVFTNVCGELEERLPGDRGFLVQSIEHLKKILALGLDFVIVDQYLRRGRFPFDFDAQVHNFFVTLNTARMEGIKQGTPCFYWAAVDEHVDVAGRTLLGGVPFGSAQVINDSWLRWPIFVALTLGYQGIGWFPYDDQGRSELVGRLTDPDVQLCKFFIHLRRETATSDLVHTPSRLFPHLARINKEVAHLGKALCRIDTDELFYLSGGQTDIGTIPPGPGIQRFFTLTEPKPPFYFKSITIETPGHKGGLLGLFTDQAQTPYFMLMNLKQDGRSAEDAVHFTVELDTSKLDPHHRARFRDGVHLERLGRETGAIELVRLTQRPGRLDCLEITIPGATGDLFKWADDRLFAHLLP